MLLVSYMCKWQVAQAWILPATLPTAARSSPLREQQGSPLCRARGFCWEILVLQCRLFYGVPRALPRWDDLGGGRMSLEWWCWPQTGLQISDPGGLGSTPASQHPGSGPCRARCQTMTKIAGIWTQKEGRAAHFPPSFHGAAMRPTNGPKTAGHSGALLMGCTKATGPRQSFTSAHAEEKREGANHQCTHSLTLSLHSYPVPDFSIKIKQKPTGVLRNKHHEPSHYMRFLFVCLFSRYIRPAWDSHTWSL